MRDRLLRLREVMGATGLGSSTIYRYIQAGTFPAPVKIGGFTSRWRSLQVEAWIAGLSPKDFKSGVRAAVSGDHSDEKHQAAQCVSR